MSEADTQTVADPANTAPTAPAAASDAQQNTSDLESILSEFETQTQPTTTQPAPTQAAPVADQAAQLLQVQMKLDALERRDSEARNAADIERVTQEIKGDLPVDDYAVEGWLARKARTNPAIDKIWAGRAQNPAAAKKLVAALKKEFGAEQAKKKTPDANATEDRLAVAAAVKGTSTKVPDAKAPNYGAMNEVEFRQELAKFGL